MKSQNWSDKTTVLNLTIFITLVLASGWIGWGLDRLMGNPSVESIGMLLWIITPLVVSLLLRTFGGDAWKDFGIKPNFKGNWIWYLFSILVFSMVTALVVIIGSAFGWIRFPNLSANTPALILEGFVLGLLMHAVEDAFNGVVIAEKYIRMRPGADWLISPMNGFLMSLFFIVIGVWLHQYRKRRTSVASKGNIRTVAGVA